MLALLLAGLEGKNNIKLIEAYGTLPVRFGETLGVEGVVASKKPKVLRVPSTLERKLA